VKHVQIPTPEAFEELTLTITDAPTVLDTVITTLEGKRDTLTIMQATPVAASFRRSPEIAEARWVRACRDASGRANLALAGEGAFRSQRARACPAVLRLK
jgi:hypothetical protein